MALEYSTGTTVDQTLTKIHPSSVFESFTAVLKFEWLCISFIYLFIYFWSKSFLVLIERTVV